MNSRFLVVSVLFLIISCGTKKRGIRNTSSTPKKSGVSQPIYDRQSADDNGSALYPLPADPGYFKKFTIANTVEYIQEFAPIAQHEMRAYGIPASITLAQGILESASGRGVLTQKTNNHFGIKCHAEWQGDYELHDDDAQGECFRKYNHPMFSFRDHSIFLTSRPRYQFLFNYRRDNYKKWAHGLKKAGYATDKKYPQKLIGLIERYDLDTYDDVVIKGGLPAIRKPIDYTTYTYIIQKGDTLYGISRKQGISIDEIMRLNNLKSTNLSVGMKLNLRKAKLQ